MSGDLLRAEASPSRSAFAARLAAKARRLALAHAENRLRARRKDGARWRQARLLWPLFASKISED